MTVPAQNNARRAVREYMALSNYEKDHEDPPAPEFKSLNNWSRAFDTIDDHLRECLGTTKIPLAWVVREARTPPDHADDPAANCANPAEELVARAPHYVVPVARPCIQHPRSNLP